MKSKRRNLWIVVVYIKFMLNHLLNDIKLEWNMKYYLKIIYFGNTLEKKENII